MADSNRAVFVNRPFTAALPEICGTRRLDPTEVTFGDYSAIVAQYLAD
jgi:hypothetical protein